VKFSSLNVLVSYEPCEQSDERTYKPLSKNSQYCDAESP
jgi:hypothetical protein